MVTVYVDILIQIEQTFIYYLVPIVYNNKKLCERNKGDQSRLALVLTFGSLVNNFIVSLYSTFYNTYSIFIITVFFIWIMFLHVYAKTVIHKPSLYHALYVHVSVYLFLFFSFDLISDRSISSVIVCKSCFIVNSCPWSWWCCCC